MKNIRPDDSGTAKGFGPVVSLAHARAAIRSIVQTDAFMMAFNNASFAFVLGLLASAVATWIVKGPKSISTHVPAH